ncbi:YciC family protein [Candidatus Purcelliella pentastirinorum]|uniref:YciC family protein n=1 Tax=Candidatus Purcelliella pentastirinorum TaxID=472834 RepID=UPI00236818FE|nr:YciC family protein [Candidatus Purcelliella pentastirinorum]WDI79141.1 YciC family protein [Candidatus Purcelliella pentastirinorum]WDR80280.1 YciC family protein [Candidatus Purcelliella pentastirinorum]
MNINIKKISKNTIFFYKKQFIKILLISIIAAFITIIINNTLITKIEFLQNLINQYEIFNIKQNLIELILKMTKEEKKTFIQLCIVITCSHLIGNTFLNVSLINIINNILKNKKNNIQKLICKILNDFPKSLILTTIINIITEIGMIIFIVPGIIISSILSLSQIILIIEKKKIINSIKQSILLANKNIKIITFGISLIFIIKIIIFILSTKIIFFSKSINLITIQTINNLISSIQIIYIYRYYTLNKKN